MFSLDVSRVFKLCNISASVSRLTSVENIVVLVLQYDTNNEMILTCCL